MARLDQFAVFVAMAVISSCSLVYGSSNIALASAAAGQATNITITGISIPSNVGVYAPLPIFVNLTNTGSLASGNVTLGIQIFGTPEINRTLDFPGLSPGQSELALIYLYNVTRSAGGHAIYLKAGYASGPNSYVTGREESGYHVIGSGLAGYLDPQGGSGGLPHVDVTYMPLLDYLPNGSSLLSQIGLSYNDSKAASVNIGVPSAFSKMLSLSSNSLYMLPGQILSSSVLFTYGPQPYGSAYAIPVTLTEIQDGAVQGSETRYIQVYTLNSTGNVPTISGHVSLSNNSADSAGIVQVDTANYSLYGSSLELTVPAGTTANASNIDAYGYQASVTQVNGSYVIEWSIGNIQKRQDIYLYYDIEHLENPGELADQQFVLSSTTKPAGNSNFNVTGASLPILYINSTEQIQINLRYTGAAAANAVLFLPSVPEVTITNATRVASVSPNEQIQETFFVTARNYTGTALLRLHVTSGGVNSTYTFPIIILARPTDLPGLALYFLRKYGYEILAVIMAAAAVVAYAVTRKRSPKRYDPERAKRLITLREQMERD